MNYFTCKVGSNHFITEKRKKTSSTPCLQSHYIQLQEKQKKQKQKNYVPLTSHTAIFYVISRKIYT